MDEWERLEREATAGPVKLVGRNRVGHDGLGASLPGGGRAVFDEPAEASLHVYLRNRSPQLRALVDAVREMAAAEDAWNAANAGTIEEHDAERAHDRAMHAAIDALKALDEVGHG